MIRNIPYKNFCSPFSRMKENLDNQISNPLDDQSEYSMNSILSNLLNSMESQNEDETLLILKILEQKKELDFTLQIVEYYDLFDKLMLLENSWNREIQKSSMTVLNLSLNWQTIEYSMYYNIVHFLIDIINSGNQSLSFTAIQSLSKIASHCCVCHDIVVFHLASLEALQTNCFDLDFDKTSEYEYDVTELVAVKGRRGRDCYIPYKTPGILPEESIDQDNEIETVDSFQNLNNYIMYTENDKKYICIPSLCLISSLLEFELDPIIISYCLEVLISLIPLSNEYTLEIIINSLCKLSKLKKESWNKAFQMSNPSSWIAPLFNDEKSFKITQLLMFFVSNVIKQGEIINGLPFNLLIEKLQYEDKKSLIATYAAASIDSMMKIYNGLIDKFIKLDLLIVTKNVYSNLSCSAKALIVSYLTRISLCGMGHHKKMIIEMELISLLIDVLLSNFANDELLLRIFMSLSQLFEYAKNKKNILDLCQRQVADCIDYINEFQYHENNSISKAAITFVNNFLGKEEDDDYDDDESPIFCF